MNVMGIIFANDGEIGELTDKRTTASVPFGGRYRQVDFALSNMIDAGIRHIGIISRHTYQSLMNHIGSGEEWGLELEEGGLEFLTPYAMSTTDNYRGKLETLYSAMDFLEYGADDEYVVMTGSAILCNMDMNKLLASHVESGKDITVVTKADVANGRKQLDLALKLDGKGNIEDIAVDFKAPTGYLASMDIFVLSKRWLMERVKECVSHNLFHMDRDLVLGLWQKKQISINVYQFEGAALYNESVEDYFHNSLALINSDVRHDIFNSSHPIFTKVRDRVPTYYGENSNIENCIVADGCMLEGHAKNSVIFRQVTISEGAEVEDCVIMNDSVVGEGSKLKCVILDKDVTVKPGTVIMGTPNTPVIIKRGDTV
ncbi:MAG TPA: glucose-1-phosphate adenylyltransferase subunit GlgD [Candidatus Faecousia intestinigallinarum]|nr:glucose-1-phosphate adenylyltransferase subunit GlgD [Candidatus Faecousia intestinigallinarum]